MPFFHYYNERILKAMLNAILHIDNFVLESFIAILLMNKRQLANDVI